MNPLTEKLFANLFLVCCLSFHSLTSVFSRAKIFNFYKVQLPFLPSLRGNIFGFCV